MTQTFFGIIAQGGGAAPSGGLGQMLLPFIIMAAIFYFMLIRPQKRKEQERQKMIGDIKSGTRVLFSGGIIGTITNTKKYTFVVKIADNVKVEILRGAVVKTIEKGETVLEEDE